MPIEVLFVHSAGAQSGDQGSAPFVEHLREELGAGFNVRYPKMPAPTAPAYAPWKAEIERQLSIGPTPRLLVGHSLGGSVLLKYLSEQPHDVDALALFIVAAPYWGSPKWDIDEFKLRKDFADSLPPALKVFLYQARDDEGVSFDHLARYAKAIPRAVVRPLDSGGHTFKAGLPILAEDMRSFGPRGSS